MSTLKTSLSGEGIIKLFSQVYLASEVVKSPFKLRQPIAISTFIKSMGDFSITNKIGTLKSLLHFENWEGSKRIFK